MIDFEFCLFLCFFPKSKRKLFINFEFNFHHLLTFQQKVM